MSLTQKEKDFIRDTKAYFKSLRSAKQLPTVEALAEKGITQNKFLSLAGKIHSIENDEERVQQEQIFNYLWKEFYKIQIQLSEANKPQGLMFGNNKINKKKQNPHIEIEHPTNVLAELKNGRNEFLNLGEDVGDAILEAGGVVKKGAVKGAKATGKAALKGAKATGNVAFEGAKLAGLGVLAVGGGIGKGAELAWEHVLLPFKDSIVDLTNSTIKKIEDYIRAENLKDAAGQLGFAKEHAKNVLENALHNALSTVKILYPEIESKEDIEAKAKELVHYAELETALQDLDNININFLDKSEEQLKIHLKNIKEQVVAVQSAVDTVAAACVDITHEAEQHLVGADVLAKQNNKWLSKEFVAFNPKQYFSQEINRFKNIIKTKPFDAWTENTRELYLKMEQDIKDILEHGIAICEANDMYAHRVAQLRELQRALQEAYENNDTETALPLLENVLEKIADLDVAQAYKNADLESVKRSLESVNESKDALDASANKMQKSVIGVTDTAKGLARLSSKKFSTLSKNVINLMQNIWASATAFINKSPSLADKLLSCAASAMSAINKAWDTFTRGFYNFIGVKKTKENPDCIYQHKGFSPKLIKKLIQEKFMVAPDNMDDENSYVYPDAVKKRARYPYNIKINLECTKENSNDKKIIKVPIMEFYQHGVEISQFPMDLIPKNYEVSPSELAKFELAQQQLVKIITRDENGLAGVRTSKSMVLHGFDDNHFGEIMKGSAFLTAQQDKLDWKNCKFSSELEKELKPARPQAVSENPLPVAFPRK